ncbi:MAG TPA: DUF3854 domain-containing protein [Aeromicrobium sp.]|nr:DUF3854 domain-containing protein [Aeromicrobium sp.]
MTANYGMALFPQHAQMLAESGITPEHARARGYVTVDTKVRLERLGITPPGRNVPGLLVPSLRVDGSCWGYQYRADHPRIRSGKTVKYETPTSQRNGLDVPPGVGPALADPTVPLWVTEGCKKADAAALAGLACVALPGVWSWRGTNGNGGKTAISDWHDVALNGRRVILAFDSDVTRKRPVRSALNELAGYLTSKGAKVGYCHLPDDDPGKTGLDDFLAAGHDAAQLLALVRPEPPELREEPVPEEATPERELIGDRVAGNQPHPVMTLTQAHDVFARWLGHDYDLDALDAMLATAAVERLDGDPIWLLIISGSGNAKTETVQSLDGIRAIITSTISSQGALLSATSAKDKAKDATGGLLRKIGGRGVLVIKDVTSVLSMNRDMRAEVLGALREVYDGRWSRNVGTDGGRTLDWSGRIVVIGAVTTKWDQAHDVIASMGDRFVLLRMDSTTGRQVAGRKAIGNTGSEIQMRAELAAAAAGVMAGMNPEAITITAAETDVLLAAADVVTLARTGVEYDYRGDVIDAHAPEMPTRFAKQLAQVVRGGVAIGMNRSDALRLAIRCARDSMPPLRLAILDDVAANPESTTAEVRKRIDKPRATVDRQLQALHMLGVLTVAEEEGVWAGKPATFWKYSLTDGIDPDVLNAKSVPDPPKISARNVSTRVTPDKREGSVRLPTNISGTDSDECRACGKPLDPELLAADGVRYHPSCGAS